jgi:hypothetical protein
MRASFPAALALLLSAAVGVSQPMDGDGVDSSLDGKEETSVRTPMLSTDVAGLDSLGMTTDTLITTMDGGTRTISLERSVFRREEPFVYNPAGRRDPFRALIADEKREGEIVTDLLRLEGATLAGVVWSEGTSLAIVRDSDGKSFFLREGDPVYSGKLLTVTKSAAIFEISNFGEYDRITLKVESKAGQKEKG